MRIWNHSKQEWKVYSWRFLSFPGPLYSHNKFCNDKDTLPNESLACFTYFISCSCRFCPSFSFFDKRFKPFSLTWILAMLYIPISHIPSVIFRSDACYTSFDTTNPCLTHCMSFPARILQQFSIITLKHIRSFPTKSLISNATLHHYFRGSNLSAIALVYSLHFYLPQCYIHNLFSALFSLHFPVVRYTVNKFASVLDASLSSYLFILTVRNSASFRTLSPSYH